MVYRGRRIAVVIDEYVGIWGRRELWRLGGIRSGRASIQCEQLVYAAVRC